MALAWLPGSEWVSMLDRALVSPASLSLLAYELARRSESHGSSGPWQLNHRRQER